MSKRKEYCPNRVHDKYALLAMEIDIMPTDATFAHICGAAESGISSARSVLQVSGHFVFERLPDGRHRVVRRLSGDIMAILPTITKHEKGGKRFDAPMFNGNGQHEFELVAKVEQTPQAAPDDRQALINNIAELLAKLVSK